MRYEYGTDRYNKRAVTQNVLVQVIAADYAGVTADKEEYKKKAFVLKAADEVSQEDSCPIVGRQQLEPVLGAIWEHMPGLRARQTQTGNAVIIKEQADISQEDAQFLIANGTIAAFSTAYRAETRDTLLAHGILPLLTDSGLHEGDYLFLENIKAALLEGKKELTSFYVKKHLEPVNIGIDFEKEQQLDRIFAD